MRTLILDNEAVQALARPAHRQHRLVLAHLAAVVARRRKGAEVIAVVPTAVRVEAGWNRSDARAAAVNRLRVIDRSLDCEAGNVAAAIVHRTGCSVADAHIGAVARAIDHGDVVVLTSDPGDMVRVSSPRPITTVTV